MEHEYIIIEEQGEDLVVTGLKDNAPSDIVIPEGVTKIGDVGDDLLFIFRIGVFEGCKVLTSIVIPDSVTEIGYKAFCGCSGLTSINIPNGVTKIGDMAFCGCSGLTSIVIPDNVMQIGSSAFEDCPNLQEAFNHICSNNGKRLLYVPKNITEFNIPDSVTKIGSCAFENCASLASITIPDGVTEIGSSAFKGCTGLTSITIPDSVTIIGRSAFEDCTGLTSITIPDSVTEIEYEVFRGCTGLTSITIPDSVTEIGEYAFYGCRCNVLTIPFHLINIYNKQSKSIPDEVRINISRNELNNVDDLMQFTNWNSNSNNVKKTEKLILAAPNNCLEESTIPGYIRVTEPYDSNNKHRFEDTRDKIIDVNTQYIMFIEPIEIERFEPCKGTILHLVNSCNGKNTDVVVYESPDLVAEKIKISLSNLHSSL